jgi:Flp pilus assembly protein TadG
MFALFFGLVEFGRVIMIQQLLTNASREGVRRAVVDDVTATDVQQAVSNYLQKMSVSGATVSVSPSNLAGADFGDTATVVVAVPFKEVSWLPSPWFLDTATVLTASAAMRVEKFQ